MTFNRPALRVAAIYAMLGIGWSVLSERVMLSFSPDPLVNSQVDVWMHVVFVLATTFFLYLLIGKRQPEPVHLPVGDLGETGIGPLILVFAALAVTIILMGLGGIAYTAGKQKEKEVERLRAIADLKVGQIVAWIEERHADAEIIRSDDSLSDLYDRWRTHGDTASRDKLLMRLTTHKDAFKYFDIQLLDYLGNALMGTKQAPNTVSAVLRDAALRAIETGKLHWTDLYRTEGQTSGMVYLDFIVPLQAPEGRPQLAVVLQTDPNRFLFPFVQSWPVPSATAETLLFKRDGNEVLFLNELRHRNNTALNLRVPLSNKNVLAVQVLEGRALTGQAVEGVDYRDVPVLGVVKAIPGTSWFLVAKLDKSELFAQARRDAGWIALAESLALIAAAVAIIFLYQRRELHFTRLQREQQSERLRAFQILDDITEGSTDAIFAKDDDGRYLLLNRELTRFTGKTKAEILGRDDTAIFPHAVASRLMAGDRRVLEVGRPEASEETLPTVGGARIFRLTRGPLHDADGRTIGLFGIARDITDHKYQERELRTCEARFRAIFDGVNEAVFLYNADNGAIIDANAGVGRMFGYSPKESRHLRMADLSADTLSHTLEDARLRLDQAMRGEAPIFEWPARRQDGSQLWVESSLHRAEIDGRSCILELVRDITESRLVTEKTYRLNEALQRPAADNPSGEFAQPGNRQAED